MKILLYSEFLSLIVGPDLLELVTEQADNELVFPTERWTATFRSHAQLVLHELGGYSGYSTSLLFKRLIEDAQKYLRATTDHLRDGRYRYTTEV